MAKHFEIQSGEDKQFMSALFSRPTEKIVIARDKILCIMVHGFPASHKQAHEDLFGDLEYSFNKSGIHTLRFDFRGCGSSEGLQEDVSFKTITEDLDSVLGWANTKGFQQIIYVTEGMGLSFILRKINKTTRMVFSFWPILDLKTEAKYFESGEKITGSAFDTDHILFQHNRIGLPLLDDMRRIDTENLLGTIQCPLLLQYGIPAPLQGNEPPPLSRYQTHIDFFKAFAKGPRIDITTYEDSDPAISAIRHREMISFHIQQYLDRFLGTDKNEKDKKEEAKEKS